MDRARMGDSGSILDSLGVEIIGVMSPVSICMFLVVLLVSAFSAGPGPPTSPSSSVTVATLVYSESPTDSPGHRLAGALLNAAVFVAFITAATFLLLLLYYYNCTAFLRAYTRLSAFFVLASMGGAILLSLLRRAALPLDALSAFLLLLNFSALGVFSVLSPAVPILLRQAYTVSLGIIVAAWFTRLPEWTTWTLLIALAVYDLVAVLAPKGPLKLLVDLASSRDEELPALVYEARPNTLSGSSAAVMLASTIVTASSSVELQELSSRPEPPLPANQQALAIRGEESLLSNHYILEIQEEEEETSPLMTNEGPAVQQERSLESNTETLDATRGIRLGLGDFVFYSVLVGRASMYDWMTVYACYLAIISGLGCTLILLSLCRHALPALPISIMLGVLFYFLTRMLMEPFVVGAATGLVMF